MSAPVNVPARIAAVWGTDSPEYRAAAELVEAARGYCGTMPCDCGIGGCGASDCYGQRHERASARLTAAFAQFTGAA